MDISNERLPELVAAADAAYQRARTEVFDQLAPCTPIDPDRLSPSQLITVTDLITAETELAAYRLKRLVPSR